GKDYNTPYRGSAATLLAAVRRIVKSPAALAARARRCSMPRRMSLDLAFAAMLVAGAGWSLVTPALAQSAADAANELAILLDNVTQLSSDNLVSALQDAAEAGEPLAMWQLGLMYESGTGVERDEARA